MGRSTWAVWVIALGLCGCSDAGGDGSGTQAGAGGSVGGFGGTGGTGGAAGDEAPPNLNCPEYIGPLDGEYAPKGECCYRTANSARLDAYGDGPAAELEYRLQYSNTVNHPMTLTPVEATTIARIDNHEQSLLFRFSGPRQGGEAASGPGSATIAQGRYNCDGTFSFYGATAAPARAISSDPARWQATEVPTTVDTTKDGADRSEATFADTANRKFSYVPYVNASSFELEWELISQGFDMLEIPTGEEYADCIGHVDPGSAWRAGGKFKSYSPMVANDLDLIPSITETMCQLLAFGVMAVTPENPELPQCDDPRCTPGEAGCPWLKLPESLCPLTEADQALWGCHVGAENAEGMVVNCTDTAPTGVLDPELGATSEGQCCDPLGASTTLPACNAYLMVNDFVAAAVDITDEPAESLQQDCH